MSRSFRWLVGFATLSAAASLTHLPPAQAQGTVDYRQACIQRTAEEFVVPTSSIAILNVGPLEASTGARVLTMQNRANGQTASCTFNTINNAVVDVSINKTTPPATLNYRQACIQRTAEEFVVAASNIAILREGPVSPQTGVATLFMQNRQSGRGAECRVNTRTGAVISVTLTTGQAIPSNPAAYNNGYRSGYNAGFREGQNYRRYNAGYHPEKAIRGGSGNPDPSFDRGFRDGFFAGFNAGFYGRPFNSTPPAQPQPR